MKDSKKVFQIFSVVALILAVVGISIGFAALSSTLEVTGTARVVPANWSVHFDSEYEFNDNDTSASEGSTPTINNTEFKNYQIVLTKPGDKGTYTLTVENDGDIDAKVGTVNLGSTLTFSGTSAADEALVQSNVTYTLTWADGTAIAQNDELAHGTTKDIVIEVTYDSEATALPENPVTVSGRDLVLTFVQK